MAVTKNERTKILEAAGTRLEPVTLPSTVSTSGDHLGTWEGVNRTPHINSQITLSNTGVLQNAGGGALDTLNDVVGNYLGTLSSLGQLSYRNDQITLSSTGVLQNAGGGSITALDYGNVSGTKPPSNADNTQAKLESSATSIAINSGSLFNVFGSGSAGVVIGSGGLFGRDTGGSTTFAINASDGSIINTGDITGGSNITITGQAKFDGVTSSGGSNYAAVFNSSFNSSRGIIAQEGVFGEAGSSEAISGVATSAGGIGGSFSGSGGATGLEVFGSSNFNGSITMSSQTISNLTSGDSNALGGVGDSGWCRQVVTDSGTASSSSFGFVFQSTVTGVRTRATGGRNYVVEEFSDENLKDNITPEELGLDFINGLNPITYNLKDNPSIIYHGFGARQTKAHLSKFKKHDNDCLGRTLDNGEESTSTIGLVAPLVKAVQELNAKVKFLEDKLNEKSTKITNHRAG